MKKLLTIWPLLLLMACVDPEIDFPNNLEIVVIEGWIINEQKQHWVKVSQTVAFNSTQQEQPITDAAVTVFDGTDTFIFTHGSNGIYYSDAFTGVVMNNYTLSVTLPDGKVIESLPETLNPVPEIENISVSSFIRQNPDTGEDETIFYPIVRTQDPAEEENFYRYKGFRNDVLLNEPEQLELLSDQFINGQLLPHNISVFEYEQGQEIKIELHSLSNAAFDFLELLKLQTTSLGSSSGTAPAVLRGNLRYRESDDLVLGFFGASAVSTDSIIVQ